MMNSTGLAMQMIGLAHQLVADGHDVACVCDPALATLCETHHVRRIPYDGAQGSFTLKQWLSPEATLAQFRYLQSAFREFAPDVVAASPFGFGPAIATELAGLPLVVIGGITFPWAVGTHHRERLLSMFDASRTVLGLPRVAGAGRSGHPPWLGDLYLLQSSPRLSGPVPCTGRVRWVGDCSWDPPTVHDPELDSWLAEIRRSGCKMVYAQFGREFGGAPIFPRLVDVAARLELALVMDTGRSDHPYSSNTERVLARPFVPRGVVMPRSALAIGAGQPTTILGALAHRIPMVLLADGSGTEETTAICAELGIARVGSLAQVTTADLVDMIADALASAPLRLAIDPVAAELSRLGGRRYAAELVAECARAGTMARRRARDMPGGTTPERLRAGAACVSAPSEPRTE